MHDAPPEDVVVLFTDIEGSTPLWERDPGAMASTVAAHDALVRDAIAAHAGEEVKSDGDGFMVVFMDPSLALAFALDLGERVGQARWPVGGLRLRIGMHRGPAWPRPNPTTGRRDWLGPTVNRAARVGAAASGGQVLVTDGVLGHLPPGANSVELGLFRLKGVGEPVRLHAVYRGAPPPSPRLPRAPRADTAPPMPLDPLVGREEELREVASALSEARLVTLTGPGGIGKTRLALAHAAQAAEILGEGRVLFADLSPICTEEGLLGALAGALGVVLPAAGAERQVAEVLAGRGPLLVVLDNFEQLTDAASVVDRLLQAAPELRLLLTSRAPLRLPGERRLELEPLPLGDAMRLFEARAEAVRRGFTLDAASRPDVAELVHRLDGIPLAIELAAARMDVLSLGDLLERLDDRFRLLGRPRPGPARHATLGAALQWTWDLLPVDGRHALGRCAAFAGPFPLDAALEVVGGPEALDLVQSLRERGLLRRVEPDGVEESWFGVLETIRAFARERQPDPEGEQRRWRWLARLGEEAAAGRGLSSAVRRRNLLLPDLLDALPGAMAAGALPLAAAMGVAAAKALELRGPLTLAVRVLRELDAQPLPAESAGEVRLQLGHFLRVSGRAGEALELLDGLLDQPGVLSLEQQARARLELGDIRRIADRTEEAETQYDLALQALAEHPGLLAAARARLAILRAQQGRLEEAVELGADALQAFAKAGDVRNFGLAAGNLALHLADLGRVDEARRRYAEALAAHRAVGNQRSAGVVLGNLARLYDQTGEHGLRDRMVAEALMVHRLVGNRRHGAISLGDRGLWQARSGRLETGLADLESAAGLAAEVGDRRTAVEALVHLAVLLAPHDPAAARAHLAQADELAAHLGEDGPSLLAPARQALEAAPA